MTVVELLARIRENYFSTRKNKRYGADQMDYESDWTHRTITYMLLLFFRTFRILSNYAFLTSTPRWREIFATFFEGRMSDHLLCDPLKPYFEKELSDRTFNNREGKGSVAAINQVIEDIATASNGYTEPARIIKLDISGYFPNARWSVMEECFQQVIDKYKYDIDAEYGEGYGDFLKWIAMISINCNPTSHCVLKTPRHYWYSYIDMYKSLFPKTEGVGAPIGRLSSQHAMGLYINDIILWLSVDCGILVVCFVDDIVMVVPESLHLYALSLIPVIRERLRERGLNLAEHKFYDQPWQHGLEFLGSHIKPYRIHLNNSTYNRAMLRIGEFNAMSRAEKLENIDMFVSSINSYTGLLKNRTDYKRTISLRNSISAEWQEMTVWEQRRQCVLCRPEYSVHARLARRYGSDKRKYNNSINVLKIMNYDKERTARAA